MFKTGLAFEKYLECVTNHRNELARFRCSSHNLEIEVGSYNYKRVEGQNRLLRCCIMGMGEDEYPFLHMRPSSCDIHRQCLSLYYSRWHTIMTESHSNVDKHLAKCVFLAMDRRTKHT